MVPKVPLTLNKYNHNNIKFGKILRTNYHCVVHTSAHSSSIGRKWIALISLRPQKVSLTVPSCDKLQVHHLYLVTCFTHQSATGTALTTSEIHTRRQRKIRKIKRINRTRKTKRSLTRKRKRFEEPVRRMWVIFVIYSVCCYIPSQDKHRRSKKDKKDKKKSGKKSDKKDSSDSSSSSSSDSDSDSSSSDDGNVRRSIITGKKIKMHRETSTEDRLLEIERAAKRHYMNSQY